VTTPSRPRCLAELVALTGFALAQPLLSVFGQAPDQFALRGASSEQIIAFGLAVIALPPLGLWIFELGVGAVRDELRGVIHRVLSVTLVGLVLVQLIPRSVPRPLAVGLATAGGVAAVAARQRWEAVRIWLVYAAVGPLAFLGLFLLASPTGALLRADAPMADVAVGAPAPVVMVVLDELPLESLIDADGQLDRELFPNLAHLADRSHWFRNTTSVSPATWHAVPAIATGRLPEDGEGPSLADHPQNLFTLLGAQYELDVTESVTRLCPPSSCPGRATADVMHDLRTDVRRVLSGRLRLTETADDPVAVVQAERPALFEAFVSRLSGAPNTLSYLHILLPHAPSRYLPDGRLYTDFSEARGRDGSGLAWVEDPWLPLLHRQRHVLQMVYVDRLLGDLIDRMQEQGTFDDALIVVTADHGASFEPGGTFRGNWGESLTAASTPDLLWVPLFVKEPGQQTGDISDANVLTIDILPTIADVLDVELPWEVDGQSALGPPRPTNDKPWRGVRSVGWGVGVGEDLVIDGDAVWPEVLERSLDSLLPSAGDPQRLWRIGPSPELVGQPIEAVADALEAVEIDLVDPDRYSGTPPSGAAPALIHARGTPLAAGDAVAIVIDGQVAATGTAFTAAGRIEVAVMVDPALVSEGGESIELFRIR